MIELFKSRLAPSVQDTIRISGAAVDLTGCTAKFSMRPELSSVPSVDQAAATILQTGVSPNFVNEGVVRYDPQAGDVANAGFFMGWWTVILPGGASQDTDEFVIVIREHGSSIDLCTVADVKAYIGETGNDYDEEITDLVAASSQAFIERTRRELRPFAPNPQTRVFDIDDDTIADRSMFPGDLASFTAVAIKDPLGNLYQQVDVASVVAQPRFREAWRPIAELEFRRGFTQSAQLLPGGYTLEITGAFGFPQVPADIRREVKKIAAAGLARDVKRTSKTFREQAPGFSAGSGGMHEFPLSAEQVARRYRDQGF